MFDQLAAPHAADGIALGILETIKENEILIIPKEEIFDREIVISRAKLLDDSDDIVGRSQDVGNDDGHGDCIARALILPGQSGHAAFALQDVLQGIQSAAGKIEQQHVGIVIQRIDHTVPLDGVPDVKGEYTIKGVLLREQFAVLITLAVVLEQLPDIAVRVERGHGKLDAVAKSIQQCARKSGFSRAAFLTDNENGAFHSDLLFKTRMGGG